MAPRVISALAKIYSNGYRRDWNKCLEMYRLLAKEYPQSRFADEGLFQFAFVASDWEDAAIRKEAKANLKKLINKYGKSPYVEAAKELLEEMEKTL